MTSKMPESWMITTPRRVVMVNTPVYARIASEIGSSEVPTKRVVPVKCRPLTVPAVQKLKGLVEPSRKKVVTMVALTCRQPSSSARAGGEASKAMDRVARILNMVRMGSTSSSRYARQRVWRQGPGVRRGGKRSRLPALGSFAQQVALDFAGRGLGQFCHEDDILGHHVSSAAAAHVLAQFVGELRLGRSPRHQHHVRGAAKQAAPLLRDHRGLDHRAARDRPGPHRDDEGALATH